MILAVENHQASDQRTLGEIFYYISDEMPDITLIEAFHLLKQTGLLKQIFMDTINDKLSLTSEQLDQLLDAFMEKIPIELRERLSLCAQI